MFFQAKLKIAKDQLAGAQTPRSEVKTLDTNKVK